MLITVLVSQFSTLIVYGQSTDTRCNSCGKPPAQFYEYQDFVQELLSTIQTRATEGKYVGMSVSPSWFQGKIFEVPEKNQTTLAALVSNMKDKFKKTINTFGATAAILFSIGRELITKDGIGGFLILFKGRTFVEARRILLDLDALIHDKMFELGLAGGFFEEVTPINRSYMQTVLTKYTKSADSPNGLLATAQLNNGVKYFQITEMLLRTNSAMKTFIMANMISQFEEREFVRGDNKFYLSFNFEEIETMQEDYQCARGVEGLKNCDKAFKKFMADLKKIKGEYSKGASKAKKTIVDASKKFKQAFSVAIKQFKGEKLDDDDLKFLQQERELLATLYGAKADKMLKNGWFAKSNKFRKSVTDGKFSLKDQWKKSDFKKKLDKKKAELKKLSEERKLKKAQRELEKFQKDRKKEIYNCLEDYEKEKRKSLFEIIIKHINENQPELQRSILNCNTVFSIVRIIEDKKITEESLYKFDKEELEDLVTKAPKAKTDIKTIYIESIDQMITRQNANTQSMVLADNKDLTLFFTEIYEQVHITKEVIGTKDGEGLINNLGAACELQCGNKGGECYY